MDDKNSTFNIILYSAILTVVLIGLVGNILTFLVFSRKKFQKNSISVYCRALAIFDSFIVYIAVVQVYFIFYSTFLAMLSDSMCKLYFFVTLPFSSIPGWILIAFSIDKILNLRKVGNTMKRPIIHYSIIAAIVISNLLLYIEVPIFIKLTPVNVFGMTLMVCDTGFLSFSEALNVVFLIEGSLLPFVLLCISSLFTVKLLRDSRKQVAAISSSVDKRKRREIKFAITSIAFNVLFIVLKMPLLICSIIGYGEANFIFEQFANFFFYSNFSIGFFIHFASNSLFRSEFLLMLRLQNPDGIHSNSRTNNQVANRLFNSRKTSKNPSQLNIRE